jgi:siroheme synthase-like protein
MSYFPIFLEMTRRRCLVIGGGAVAERKVASLLEAGAAVAVVSPEASDNILHWAKEKSLEYMARSYQPGDLTEFELVFVATDDRAVSAQVFKEGRTLGVWVNAADDPAHCDFILPSVLRRGDLTVAVSTGGTSPALARTIREELEFYFTDEYALLANLAAEVRDELRARGIDAPFETWRRALTGDVRQLLMRGDVTRAKVLLLREFGLSA